MQPVALNLLPGLRAETSGSCRLNRAPVRSAAVCRAGPRTEIVSARQSRAPLRGDATATFACPRVTCAGSCACRARGSSTRCTAQRWEKLRTTACRGLVHRTKSKCGSRSRSSLSSVLYTARNAVGRLTKLSLFQHVCRRNSIACLARGQQVRRRGQRPDEQPDGKRARERQRHDEWRP